MDLGELPRSQLVIRVVPGPVMPGAQRNGGQIRRLLAQSVRSRVGSLDSTSRAAHGAGKGPDPFQVSGASNRLPHHLLLNACRPVTRPAPGTSAPPSIAVLIERLSTETSGLFTCPMTMARCSMSRPSSNCSHITAGSFSVSVLYSAGTAASSLTSTDAGQARRLKL